MGLIILARCDPTRKEFANIGTPPSGKSQGLHMSLAWHSSIRSELNWTIMLPSK
jgi:hypothetical protein